LSTRLYGFLLLSHPGPVAFHLLAVALFALLAGWPHLTWSTLLLVVGAHTSMQLSIAMLNDYCDRRLDAASKPGKPIPGGLVTSREALLAGCLMIALMVLLPPVAWVFSLFYLALGMAYNLGLKATRLSGVVFALAMPLIPLYAFAGMGRSLPLLLWLVPLGLLLGVALNLANSLLDLEEDAANGARTLAVVLGAKRAFLTCNTLMILGALLVAGIIVRRTLILPRLTNVDAVALVGVLALSGLLLAALLVLSGLEKPGIRRKIYFYLVVLACLTLAGAWFLGALV
jgi:4-hydroxybenzoate polyprenyltransferase